MGTLENFWSKVSAQGEIDLTGVTLQQDGWGDQQRLMEQTTSSGVWRYRTYKGGLWTREWGPEVSERATSEYASSFTAKTLSGSGTTINNGPTPVPSHRLPIAIIAAKIWRSNLTGSL